MFAERCQEVRAKVARLVAQYEARHPGQTVPQMDIRFDLRGRAAGMAGRKGMNYFMRFNRDMMLNAGWDHLIKDTVPHELAHIICFALGTDRGHGFYWRRTCIELGGNGERCHSEAVTYAKGRTYVYTTSTGRTVNLSETKHRRVQQGASYTGRNGLGRIDRTCAYSLLGSTTVITPAVSPKAVPVHTLLPKALQPAPAMPAGASKADLIRAQIRAGRSASECVQYGITVLGMTASLARTYVKNNWGR